MILRILIVEDDDAVAKVIEKMLMTTPIGSMSFECVRAASISAALKAMKESTYDCVLADLILPNGRGIATFVMLYQQTDCKKIPIGIVTGDETVAGSDLIRKGADFVIRKPLPPGQEFVEIVMHAILRYQRHQAAIREIRTTAATYENMLKDVRHAAGVLDDILAGKVPGLDGDAQPVKTPSEVVKSEPVAEPAVKTATG